MLVDADGSVVARFRPRTQPDAPEVRTAIEALLSERVATSIADSGGSIAAAAASRSGSWNRRVTSRITFGSAGPGRPNRFTHITQRIRWNCSADASTPTSSACTWSSGAGRRCRRRRLEEDFGRAMRMSKRPDVGCVWINTHIPLAAEMPHGGFTHSGSGKDLTPYGFEDYTRSPHVMANIGS